jgi:hypothetical protein
MKNYQIGEIVFVNGELCRVIQNSTRSKNINYGNLYMGGVTVENQKKSIRRVPIASGYILRYNPSVDRKSKSK